MQRAERKAAITGIGISHIGRKTLRPAMELLADAALAAMADAGLSRDDIDGVATYPGLSAAGGGASPLGEVEVINALGIKASWHSGSPEGPAQAVALMTAAMAVATEQARHVLVFRCLTESSSQPSGRQGIGTGSAAPIAGWLSWLVPMGAVSAVNWSAMFARRRMHEFGLTREQIGAQAVLQRANAHSNPSAVMRGKPLTLDDYLSSRMISDPLCLYDCDVPIDGAAAVIVSSRDAARDTRKTPLQIDAFGAGLFERFTWDQRADLTTMAAHDAAASMWARTDLKPHDVDVAGLYDGFSIFVPMWLEAFGFCGRGESGPFIAAGHTAIGGDIPTNTGGGQLSAGRLHGYGLLHEVCLQLWGEATGRQVEGAKIGIVGMGGGPLAGAILLTR